MGLYCAVVLFINRLYAIKTLISRVAWPQKDTSTTAEACVNQPAQFRTELSNSMTLDNKNKFGHSNDIERDISTL